MIVDPYDLSLLFAFRGLLDSLRGSDPPALRSILPARGSSRAVAILPGSFNPPTAAHVLLAERTLREGYDRVVFTLACETLGKPRTGLVPEDRLLMLRALASEEKGVAVCSHGLYADQAEAAAAAFPGAEIGVVVGSDKIEQLLDPHWYGDRDADLDRLFARARLVVASRGDQGERLQEMLARPQNRRWADRVESLCLHPSVGDISSTRVRGLLHSGSDPAGLLPAAIVPLLADMHAFGSPDSLRFEGVDAYTLRAKLIELLWCARAEASGIPFRALARAVMSADANGRQLRDLIATDASVERLLETFTFLTHPGAAS